MKLRVVCAAAVLIIGVSGGLAFWNVQKAKATTYPVTLKLLVMLVNFNDNRSQPITPAQAQALYFGPTNSVASYYNANSNGRIQFTGNIVGWYTIAATSTLGCGYYATWTKAAQAAAIAAGVNLNNYDYIQYVFSPTCSLAGGFGDYGTPGVYPPQNIPLGNQFVGLQSEIFGYFYVAAFSHELGHNLGQSHANAGTTAYGDYSDVMGNFWSVPGYQALTFNAPHLVNLGWVDPGEVQVINPTASSSATYTLNSLESNTGLRILEIDKPSTQPDKFYISMRQATGNDTNMPAKYTTGANIQVWSGVYNNDTNLVSVLTDGAAYADAVDGITIKQISHTAGTVTLSVTTTGANSATCTHAYPQVTTTPGNTPGIWSAPGSSATVTLNITDEDTTACSPMPVTFGVTVPNGWTWRFSPSTATLMPGQTQSIALTYTSPSNAAPSATPYQLGYDIQTSVAYLGFAMNYYVIGSTCTVAVPTIIPSPANYTVPAGTPTPYTFTVTNKDSAGCNPSTFVLTPKVPSGWTSSLTPSIVLAPGASGVMVATTTSPLNSPSGTTTLQMQLTDPQTSLHTTSASVDYGVPAAACTRTAPTLTPTPSEYSDGSAGTPKSYTLSIKNNDSAGCTPSTFVLAPPVLPAQWTASPPPSVSDNAGAVQSMSETITPAAGAPAGTTTIQLVVADSANALHGATSAVKYGIPSVCARATPTLSITPGSQTGVAGTKLSYTVQLTNRDSSACGPSTFMLSPAVPANWTDTLSTPSLLVSPDTFGQAALSVTSGAGSSNADYPVSVNASDAAFPAVHAGSASASYTVGSTPPPPPLDSNMNISATRVRSGNPSILSWWVTTGLTSGMTCSVSPASQIQSGPTSIVGSATVTSWGSSANPITAQTVPITGAITFTLSCSNGAGASSSKSTTANLVPNYQNI
jgi:hypothetical protein